MRHTCVAALCGAVAVAVALAGFVEAQSPATAIIGATVTTGNDEPPIPNAAILVRDGRIAAVGPASRVPIPPGAKVVDARGKYVIPGLIDGHAHFRSWAGELYLNHGVTTVIDGGNPPEWMFALREGRAKGKVARIPRIYSCGPGLNGTRPPHDGWQGFGSVIRLNFASRRMYFDDAEPAARYVATMMDEQGWACVKVLESLPPNVLGAVAAEARRRGTIALGHTHDVYAAVRAGLGAVEHLWGIAETTMSAEDLAAYRRGDIACPFARMRADRVEELIRFLVQNKVYVNPMLVDEHQAVTDRVDSYRAENAVLLGDPRLQYIPADARTAMLAGFDRLRNYGRHLGNFPYVNAVPAEVHAEFREGYRRAQDFVRKFVRAGGKIWFGTDAGGDSVAQGLSAIEELELLVDAGLTPLQAIQAATRTAAEMIGRSHEVGLIAPGRFADLVVLDADPLADVGNVRRIAMVFSGGDPIALGYSWNYAIPITNPLTGDNSSPAYLPVPALTRLDPASAVEGGAGFVLEITGVGFGTRSVVTFNGVPLATTFRDPEHLSAEVPASHLRTAGTWPIHVHNPPPGGGASTTTLGFIVRYR